MTRWQRAYVLLFAVTLTVYAVMLLWSLPAITAAAGGLPPFDLRPAGYTAEQARAFLAALSPAGVAFYRTVQHRLDLFYPALLAATLFFGIARLLPQRLGAWRWICAAPTALVAAFDYAENASVAVMLAAGPDLSEDLVHRASNWTVLKSGVTTVAMVAVLVLLLWRGFAWWQSR